MNLVLISIFLFANVVLGWSGLPALLANLWTMFNKIATNSNLSRKFIPDKTILPDMIQPIVPTFTKPTVDLNLNGEELSARTIMFSNYNYDNSIPSFTVASNQIDLNGGPIESTRRKANVVGDINGYPFLVSVRNRGYHYCAGTIISNKYVLTAAHCVDSVVNIPSALSIQYGVSKISPRGPNTINVKKVTVHEWWNENSAGWYHDIAVLELEDIIIFGEKAQPVELAAQNEPMPKRSTVDIIGWGLTYSDSSTAEQVMETQIFKYFDYYCQKLEKTIIPKYQFCAGIVKGDAGQCTGDSGGPAMINGKQFGIISSANKPCGSPGKPGIFTKIPFYRNWIYYNTGV